MTSMHIKSAAHQSAEAKVDTTKLGMVISSLASCRSLISCVRVNAGSSGVFHKSMACVQLRICVQRLTDQQLASQAVLLSGSALTAQLYMLLASPTLPALLSRVAQAYDEQQSLIVPDTLSDDL